MTQKEVQKILQQMAEKDYKWFSAALIPGVDNMLGIRIPQLRDLAKRIARDDWQSPKKWTDPMTFEEHMLQGLVIGYAKLDLAQLQESIAWYAPTIDNWSICDTFCSTLKGIKKHLPEMWEYLMSYRDSVREFEVRMLAVLLMDYYLLDEYIDEVLQTLYVLPIHEYYTSMGIAWAYATAWAKYPEQTKTFLLEHPLEEETWKRMKQKCRDSYRISQEDKEFMRKWSVQEKDC